MNAADLIRALKEVDPETEVRFFKYEEGSFGEHESTEIFVEDISKGEDCLEVLLGR